MVEREHPAPIPPEGWPCAPPQAPEAMNTTPTPQAAGPVDLLLLAAWLVAEAAAVLLVAAAALLLPHPHRPGRGLR